jgi:hypothetical protein
MKHFKILLFTITVLITTQLNSQIGIDWVRNYGGTTQEFAYDSDINSTSGEIFLLGRTNSNDFDINGNTSSNGATWIVKMTSIGDTLWTKTVVSSQLQQFQNIKVASDNGFIIFNNQANNSSSSKTTKYNSNGIEQWSLNTCYFDLIESNDGSYYGIKKIGNDCYLDRISASGMILSSFTYTSCNYLKPSKLFKTIDGSFLIGSQLSGNNDCELNSFSVDYETINIIKLNSSGSVVWQNTYGGTIFDAISGGEYINSIKQLSNGSYLIAASASSQGNDVQGHHGQSDIWLFKLDNNGTLFWSKCFGGSGIEGLSDIEINSLDEIYFTGMSNVNNNSNNGDHVVNPVINPMNVSGLARNTWLVKLASNGDLLWQGQFGSNDASNYPKSIKIRNNGTDIFIFGESSDATGNNDENNGMSDFWVVKFKPCSNIPTPIINEVPLLVNCSGFSTQLEVQNNPNATYQWFTLLNGLYNELQGQNINTLNNNSLSQSTETYALLTVVNNCPVISSKIYQPTFISLPQNQNICIVGLDQTTGKNKVVWEKELTQVISGYKVYRENSQTGSFDLIGSTNYSDSSLFLDATANPIQQAYRYQITYVDTCGNESTAGSPHKTMHLTINQGVGTTWNLIWTAYSGIGYPSYNIYRGTNASNMTLLSTVASNITSYTDANAPSGFVYYQIEIVSPTNCNPTKSNYNNSRSNVSTNDPSYLGVNEEMISPISIYPNPACNLINIDYSGNIEKLEILDARGAVVFVSKENKRGFSLPNDLQTGYYMVVIHDEKQLYRKELLIQR